MPPPKQEAKPWYDQPPSTGSAAGGNAPPTLEATAWYLLGRQQGQAEGFQAAQRAQQPQSPAEAFTRQIKSGWNAAMTHAASEAGQQISQALFLGDGNPNPEPPPPKATGKTTKEKVVNAFGKVSRAAQAVAGFGAMWWVSRHQKPQQPTGEIVTYHPDTGEFT